ncbi:MAG: hypothetical protein ACFFC3_13180, partial [Candidatus Odinarchaeota archaeon]
YTCKKNILIRCFYMFGFPTETKAEAIKTLKFADALKNVTFPLVFFVRYYPGTKLYNVALKYGFTGEMLKNSISHLYHDASGYGTPTLNTEFIKYIKDYFLYKIIFDKERISHMLMVKNLIYPKDMVLRSINATYNLDVKSIEEFHEYVKAISRVNVYPLSH